VSDEDELGLCLRRFSEVNAQIARLLSMDVATFVRREVKRAFLDRSDVANDLTDEAVQELKRAMEALAGQESDRVGAILSVPASWEAAADPPEDGWSLEGVETVWLPVAAVGPTVHGFLSERGLGSTEPPAYQAPRYFVDGMYLPTLGEHHWRLRDELQTLRAKGADSRAEADRSALEERWDNA